MKTLVFVVLLASPALAVRYVGTTYVGANATPSLVRGRWAGMTFTGRYRCVGGVTRGLSALWRGRFTLQAQVVLPPGTDAGKPTGDAAGDLVYRDGSTFRVLAQLDDTAPPPWLDPREAVHLRFSLICGEDDCGIAFDGRRL